MKRGMAMSIKITCVWNVRNSDKSQIEFSDDFMFTSELVRMDFLDSVIDALKKELKEAEDAFQEELDE